jgi:hypothetical protein
LARERNFFNGEKSLSEMLLCLDLGGLPGELPVERSAESCRFYQPNRMVFHPEMLVEKTGERLDDGLARFKPDRVPLHMAAIGRPACLVLVYVDNPRVQKLHTILVVVRKMAARLLKPSARSGDASKQARTYRAILAASEQN